MSHPTRSKSLRRSAVAALIAIVAGGVSVADAQYVSGQVQQGDGTKQCCFNNFRFAGTCAVQVGRNQPCSTVLSYLNNFNSVGQAYCGNTTVRGGWSMVDCGPNSTSSEIQTDRDLLTPQNPTRAPRATSPQTTTGTRSTTTAGTGSQNFVSPVSPSDVTVSEPGVINL